MHKHPKAGQKTQQTVIITQASLLILRHKTLLTIHRVLIKEQFFNEVTRRWHKNISLVCVELKIWNLALMSVEVKYYWKQYLSLVQLLQKLWQECTNIWQTFASMCLAASKLLTSFNNNNKNNNKIPLFSALNMWLIFTSFPRISQQLQMSISLEKTKNLSNNRSFYLPFAPCSIFTNCTCYYVNRWITHLSTVLSHPKTYIDRVSYFHYYLKTSFS